ncbi:MAG TPA: HAD family hydrolase [Lachnospiraceae bacterium]|nr:HAD family hydrolase [Lachnospiraceae bacterium]
MDSLIFDIDGTLWDSVAQVAEAWQTVCREENADAGLITVPGLRKEFGKTLPEIGVSLFSGLEAKDAIALMEKCCTYENEYLLSHRPPAYPGVEEVFRTLSKRIPLFIVSNCQAGYIEVFLEDTGLAPYVKDHLCPGDTNEAKAANIRTIISRYQLKSPAYVGDTIGDYNAVREAGLTFIYAEYGFGSVPNPDFRISRPSDLLNLKI